MRPRVFAMTMTLLLALPLAAQMRPETASDFGGYVGRVEAQFAHEQSTRGNFLGLGAGERVLVQNGEVAIRQIAAGDARGGLIHHWVAWAFIPDQTLASVLAVMKDVERFPQYYAPEVVSAESITGPEPRVRMRMRKRNVIEVVLDAEYRVEFGRLDAAHQFSSSKSVRIDEVRGAGGPKERRLGASENHGFLWAMNTYWRYVEDDGGVYLRCESISLTRDVPSGLGWLIGGIVTKMPRESLRSTLEATRTAVVQQSRTEAARRMR